MRAIPVPDRIRMPLAMKPANYLTAAFVISITSLIIANQCSGDAPVTKAPSIITRDSAAPGSTQDDQLAVTGNLPVIFQRTAACTRAAYTPMQLAAADPAFLALDIAEAEWLANNYYPTQRQLGTNYTMPVLEHGLRSKKSALAGVLLGYAREMAGEYDQASSAYYVASTYGSLYAYIKNATVRAEHSEISDQEKMMLISYMLAAEQIGDHRAGYYADKYAADLDRVFWEKSIVGSTANFISQARDSDKHFPHINRVPRPNKEKWEHALAGSSVVEVCVR